MANDNEANGTSCSLVSGSNIFFEISLQPYLVTDVLLFFDIFDHDLLAHT